MPHILIVEDEAAIADTLIFALQGEGFTTTWLSLGAAALEHQRQTPADLIILDIGLPDISGFETCKQLRRFSEVPVLFLSARDAEIDRVVGLEIGADDYVVKPFSPREVAARVRAILKRMAPRPLIEATSTLFRIDLERVQISLSRPATEPDPPRIPSAAMPARTTASESSVASNCSTRWALPPTPVTSAASTATSKACAPNCGWCRPMPSRSRPIAASVTATARGTADVAGAADLPGVCAVCRPDRLFRAQHGDGRNPPRRASVHRRNPGRHRQPDGGNPARRFQGRHPQ